MTLNALDPVEAGIIANIIDRAFKVGYRISVDDGKQLVVQYAEQKQRRLVEIHIGNTDATTLLFRDVNRGHIGGIVLVHGNGANVIQNYTDRREITDLFLP